MKHINIDEADFFELTKRKKIIIFGASYMAQEAIKYYSLNKQVVCMVDNDSRRWNSYYDVNGEEVVIKGPDSLKDYNNSQHILLIANNYYIDIMEQLKEMDYLDKLDYYVYLLMKEESIKSLKNNPKVTCSGCYACYNICPENCIEMQEDEEGFPFPVINNSKCINCMLCEQVCPIKNKPKSEIKKENWDIYAAWSLDEELRLSSSSGGIFSELALSVLKRGGFVAGVRFNKNFDAEHCIVNNEQDLSQLRYSKYVQSNVGMTYEKIRVLLDQDKTVLFSGTPCQAGALENYLGKKYSNLLNCSFLCGGYNSPNAFHAYLKSIEEKYESKVKNICLRDKKSGWYDINFSVKIELENGQEYYKLATEDFFMKGFTTKALFCRHSCFDCKFANENRTNDITLADLWGGKRANPFLPTQKGVSLVICHTENGKKYFEEIKQRVYYEKHSFENVHQLTLTQPIQLDFRRNLVMKKVNEIPFDKLMKHYL